MGGIQRVFHGVLAVVLGCSLCFSATWAEASPLADGGGGGSKDAPAVEVPSVEEDSPLDGRIGPALPDDLIEGEATAPDFGDTASDGMEGDRSSGLQDLDSEIQPDGEESSENDLDEVAGEIDPVLCPIKAGLYLIQPAISSTRVMDVSGGSHADGAGIQLWDSNMSGAQRFRVAVDADGYAIVANAQSGKVLDVAGASAKPGTAVWQYSSNDTKAQKWRVIENADGTYSLESALMKGLVLDVFAAVDGNGSKLQVYAANGSKAQGFNFIGAAPVVEGGRTIADGVYEVSSVLAAGKNLDVSSASFADGADVQIYDSNHSFAQRFLIQMNADGYYRIEALHSGKSLDVNMGNLIPGTKVHQWSGGNTANQLWAIRKNDDGSVAFICKANAQALDVRWAGVSNGTLLQSYTDNSSIAQKWNLTAVGSLLDEGYYRIKSVMGTGRSLDIAAGSADQGANLQLWSWNGSCAQRYKLTMTEDGGSFTLEALCSGYLLTQKGGNVVQAPIDSVNPLSQQWRAVPSGVGGISLVNAGSDLALDVSGAGDWDGNNIGAYRRNSTAAQAFFAEKVDVIGDGTFVLRSYGGRVLDVAAGSRSNGANVQVYEANDSGAQKWNFRAAGNGWYMIENARSKKALDVAERSTVSGANVQQWESAGSANQLWRIAYVGGGRYSVTSALGSLSLNVDGGGAVNGQNVTVRSSEESAAQQFRIESSSYIPEDFSDRIASFTTYSTNTFAGTYNMQRALNSFNGYVILPGQTMSFFGVAGPCGAAQGYLPAGIVGGIGYGGGICQASTTLYGVSIRAGLTIVERRNHSVPSTYVPIGLDAMVDYGSSDFKVRNDLGFPVKIVTNTPGSTVQADIYGIQPEWFDFIEPQSWWTGSRSASAQRTYYKNGEAVYVERLRDSFY